MHKRFPFFFFLLGCLMLAVPEVLKVYFIMPMPGSQQTDNTALAYGINQGIWLSRFLGGTVILMSLLQLLRTASLGKKIGASVLLILTLLIVYATNFVMLADKMFYQPEQKIMADVAANKIDDERLVIGVSLNGEASAYPVKLIGYHHQVRDTVGGEAVMVTYCTVCRTGRVFKPEVNGQQENFRLVGMDQFNAMFEDATTKSWWRQATGECCAGPLKGQSLPEVASQQMTLRAWRELYPNTRVLQPDPKFADQYAGLEGYDNAKVKSSLVGTDSTAGNRKSWVVGVVVKGASKIYDWNLLREKWMIEDVVGSEPIVLLMNMDKQSFHCFSRMVNHTARNFLWDGNFLSDTTAQLHWAMDGRCVEHDNGELRLQTVAAYQEFRHSFVSFHPQASFYTAAKN